jgi:hypothetical protein
VTGTAANSCLVQTVLWDGLPHRVGAAAEPAAARAAASIGAARQPVMAK